MNLSCECFDIAGWLEQITPEVIMVLAALMILFIDTLIENLQVNSRIRLKLKNKKNPILYDM